MVKVFKFLAAILCFAAVATAQVWNSATPPTVADGATITIAAGASGQLVVPENATITIRSTGMVNNENREISFNIEEDAKVIWSAQIISLARNVVVLNGSGTFEVIAGAQIINGDRKGGELFTERTTAINPNDAITLRVLGGEIKSLGRERNAQAISFSEATVVIEILGGEVGTYGTFSAIASFGATPTVRPLISGGVVYQVNSNFSTSMLNITDNGVVVSFENADFAGNFDLGTKNRFATLPTDAQVSWGTSGGQNGIVYPNGFFVPRSSYAFALPQTFVWNAISVIGRTGLINGDTVQIASCARGTLIIPPNAVITIVGNIEACSSLLSFVNPLTTLDFNIPPTSRVVWRANFDKTGVLNLSGNMAISGRLRASGGGELELAGGSIICRNPSTGSGSGFPIRADSGSTIKITGTAISRTGTVGEIINADNGSTVIVSGGRVSTGIAAHTGGVGSAISANNGSTVIVANGGEVISGISSDNSSSTHILGTILARNGSAVIVSSGGRVISNGIHRHTSAITIDNTSSVKIEDGGVVANVVDHNRHNREHSRSPIRVSNNSDSITISGGFLIANREFVVGGAFNLHGVLAALPTGNLRGGAVIAYQVGSYPSGSRNGLLTFPENADVYWGRHSGQVGIFYPDGFFPIEGVTLDGVVECQVCRRFPCACPISITWNADGGLPAPVQTTSSPGGRVLLPAEMTKDGYIFVGWFLDAAFQNAATFPILNVNAPIILWAKWDEVPNSIRQRQPQFSLYGILLENAIASDVARFSVITPEPAVANIVIFDNLGNVVFSADGVGAYCIRPATMPVGDLGVCNTPLQWNLTNPNGRLVANGTYIIAVEAIGISGKRYHYSTRIGVKR